MYVTTAALDTANIQLTDFTNTNTWEVPVLDGYSFSQDVETQNISISEASCQPARGQKIFNTALNPVEVSFPTYIKPYDSGTGVDCVEKVIWEAFVGNDPVGTNAVPSTNINDPMIIDFGKSDVHELGKISIVFVLDTTAYVVTDIGVNQVEFDFAIDAIAMLNWSGQGAAITEFGDGINMVAGTNYIAEGTGTTAPQFIKNKLSNIELYSDTKTDLIGFQTINYGGGLLDDGSDAIGIAADTYSFNISVEGGTEEQVDVATAGGEDVAALIVLIDAQLALTADTNKATIDINSFGDLSITSSNTGSALASLTSISINETGVTTPLFTELGVGLTGMIFQGIMESQAGLDAGKQYLIPITGGALTLTNNVTYLTPEELGKVNKPIPGGFTGTREFGGTLTAYLNTGDNKSGGLLSDLTSADSLNDATNRFYVNIIIGGCNAAPKVEVIMEQAQLTVPTFSVEDVLSTEIGFTAIGTDLNMRDEVVIKYYAEDK